MKQFEHPSLQCLYCDDIRNEADGKTTIVGWYGKEAITLPPTEALNFPIMCIVGLLALPLATKISTLKVQFMQDENIVQSIDVPAEPVEAIQATDKESSHLEINKFGIQIRIILKLGIQINQPCILRLRVLLDDDELNGNGLRFIR